VKAFDYAERVSSLTHEQRLHFYEVLAHQLTVAGRTVWTDDVLADAQKVAQLKWLNEVLHGVTAKVYALRLRTHEWSEAASFADFAHWVGQEPGLAPRVAWAIHCSYDIVADSPTAQDAEPRAAADGGA